MSTLVCHPAGRIESSQSRRMIYTRITKTAENNAIIFQFPFLNIEVTRPVYGKRYTDSFRNVAGNCAGLWRYIQSFTTKYLMPAATDRIICGCSKRKCEIVQRCGSRRLP